MRPSTVAGASGAAFPENRAQVRAGAKALVVDADHPDVVAFTTIVTPADGLKLFISARLFVYFALS
jgi:ribonucleotide reductase alpha subunit